MYLIPVTVALVDAHFRALATLKQIKTSLATHAAECLVGIMRPLLALRGLVARA